MTKRVTVDVECSVEDFDVDDVIYDLKKRHLTQDELEDIYEFSRKRLKKRSPKDNVIEVEVDSLLDKMKFELLKEAMQRYTLHELENKLSLYPELMRL